MKRILILLVGLMMATSLQAMTQYGPTKRGDTLWRIALQYRVAKVSTPRMVQAITQLNPQAFAGNDGSSLRTGVRLQIPTTVQEVQAAIKGVAVAKAKPSTPAKAPTTATQSTKPKAKTVAPGQLPFKEHPNMSRSQQLKQQVDELKQVAHSAQQASAQAQQNIAVLQQQLSASEHKAKHWQQVAETHSDSGSSIWAWCWFIVFLLTLALYLRSRHIVRLIRHGQQVAAQRLGRHGEHQGDSISRYDTLGMQVTAPEPTTITPTKRANSQGDGKVIADAMIDMAEKQYAKAERRLLDAIRKNKRSLNLRLKLLEVYVAMDNKNAFNKQSEYLQKHFIHEGDEVWNKVREMYLQRWVYDE